jgi:hypothetical protein
MKTKSLLSLGLASALSMSSTIFLAQNPSLSQSANEIQFNCAKVSEIDSGDKIPATVVWIPEERKNVPLIYWKSQAFQNWSPEARCDKISPKFQQAYEEGRLNYLTIGKVNGSDVICAITREGQSCNSKNLLFTIKSNQNADLVLQQLSGAFEGNSGPIYQSGGKDYIQINLEKLAEQPGVEIEE